MNEAIRSNWEKKVLQYLKENNGIAHRNDMAKALNTSPTNLYSILQRLEQKDKVYREEIPKGVGRPKTFWRLNNE